MHLIAFLENGMCVCLQSVSKTSSIRRFVYSAHRVFGSNFVYSAQTSCIPLQLRVFGHSGSAEHTKLPQKWLRWIHWALFGDFVCSAHTLCIREFCYHLSPDNAGAPSCIPQTSSLIRRALNTESWIHYFRKAWELLRPALHNWTRRPAQLGAPPWTKGAFIPSDPLFVGASP